MKPIRHVGGEPVQRLVEASVAGEDDHCFAARAAGLLHELGGVRPAIGPDDGEVDDAPELRLDGGEPLLADAGCERIDHEDCVHGDHSARTGAPPATSELLGPLAIEVAGGGAG